MRLLAVDVGTRNCGLAWADGPSEPAFRTHELPAVQNDGAWFMVELRLMLHGLFADVRPEVVVYESPGKFPNNDLWTDRKLHAAGLYLELYCHDKNVKCHEEPVGPVRSRFLDGCTPRGRDPIKEAVKAECRRRGWDVTDDDQADALALLEFLRVELGITGTKVPLLEFAGAAV